VVAVHANDPEGREERVHRRDRANVREATGRAEADEGPLVVGLDEEDLSGVDRAPPVAAQVQEHSFSRAGHCLFSHVRSSDGRTGLRRGELSTSAAELSFEPGELSSKAGEL